MADSMRLAVMAGINVTPLMEGPLGSGLCGCEGLGPHGHGVMRPALLCFSGKKGGSDRRTQAGPLCFSVSL